MLGVLWNNYSSRSVKLNEQPQKLMAKLSTLRNNISSLKKEIDDVRGILATMFLLDNENNKEMVELNQNNLNSIKMVRSDWRLYSRTKSFNIWKNFLSLKSPDELALSLTSILMFAECFRKLPAKI